MTTDTKTLRSLAEKATPGPWRQGMVNGQCRKPSHAKGGHPGPRGNDPCVYSYVIQCEDEYDRRFVSIEPNVTLIGSDDYGPMLSEANAAFIAAANPQTVVGLLDENDDLHRELKAVVDYAIDVIHMPASAMLGPDAPVRVMRHLAKELKTAREQLTAMTAARNEACDLADYWRHAALPALAQADKHAARIAELRKVGEK